MDNIQTFSLHFFCSLYEKHICLASTTQCLKITQKVSFLQHYVLDNCLFKQMIWDTFYLSYIRSGVYAKVLLSFKSRITSNENSNATFLVIFKHCALQGCGALVAHFLRTTSSFSSQQYYSPRNMASVAVKRQITRKRGTIKKRLTEVILDIKERLWHRRHRRQCRTDKKCHKSCSTST